MAGTINYLYSPGDTVHVIDECCDANNTSLIVPTVRPGKVIRVRIEALVTETNLAYDIQVDGQSGTTEFTETDVFADLTTAIAEYSSRLALA